MLTDTLEQLMYERGINKRQLSIQANIPYSTLCNIWNRGSENATLTTLNRLAKFFNVSLNELTGISPNKHIPNGYVPIEDTHTIPILGVIACGKPILSIEEHEDDIQCPKSILADFALICKGDSMKDARILDGDIVLIRRQHTADNGDIVAAEIEGEATLKRFYKKPNGIMLSPANPKYDPIFLTGLDASNFRIDGIAVGFLSTTMQ